MELTKLTENVSQVSLLGTHPRVDNNLSIEQLKAWFDKAPEFIKGYLNDTLLPELEAKFDSLDSWVEGADERIDSFAIGSGFLLLTGGTMLGSLDMNLNRLTNVITPSAPNDAANKSYVDNKYLSYVDNKHLSSVATLLADGWSEEAPYTQAVTVAELLATDTPHVGPVYSDDTDTAIKQQEAWGMVSKSVTEDGNITFTCFEGKPEVDIPIQLEVNR